MLIGTVGIAAILLAYALSPGVRHAVSHAERSVRHAVSHVFDRDRRPHPRAKHPARSAAGARPTAHAKAAIQAAQRRRENGIVAAPRRARPATGSSPGARNQVIGPTR
jgi:hypothetical protein